jgi:predicted AAA+ superfamily ATPase
MNYEKRIVDKQVERHLKASGALLIRGPKGCGKTETARFHSKSELLIDDSPAIEIAMQSDPTILLKGEVPRLIDEWQEQTKLWNTIRHEVDRRKLKGQFILTGSANPEESVKMHSGSGRFGVIRMDTMSWYERGWSTGEVSLRDMLQGNQICSEMYEAELDKTATRLVIGGWPANLGLSEDDAAFGLENYIDLLVEVDLSRVSDVKRDPIKVRRVLLSIARNIATECPTSRIAIDAGGAGGALSENTVADYLDALNRLMITDDLPAWSPHVRSRARLRGAAKRHFCDPSLVAAILGVDSARLLKDLEFMGFLFESQVIHDLRVYSGSIGAKLLHYRDSNGVEADAIIEKKDGSWAAFEVKLGMGGADQGAASLLKLAETIDSEKSGTPLALTVITGSGFAHKRKDGVNIVPLGCMRD